MKTKEIMIAVAMALAGAAPANAGGVDLSAFGTPVDPTIPTIPPPAPTKERASSHWPAHICAEIQRMETSMSSSFGHDTRGISRLGLLTLEARHCGIDISKKMDADQAAMEEAARRPAFAPTVNCVTNYFGDMATTDCN